jgi:hypothetical protein
MRLIYVVCIAGLASACAVAEAGKEAVAVDMRNVNMHVSDDITLHITRLKGRFVAVGRASPFLDNKRSYTVEVDAGEIALDLASLNQVMARSMAGDKSNVRKLRVWFNPDGTLGQSGVIDSKINVPFRSKAVVSVTGDGRIRVSTTSVSSKGVPLTPVMKVLGLHMDSLVKMAPGTGVVAEGNDLVLDPSQLLPAPAVRGRVTAVRIANNRLVQTFGPADAPPAPPGLSPNHIYWKNGELAFGKLTMTETDLELVDADPADPFDFSIDHWDEQLVAGYSKTLPNRGLRAHLPDYDDLRARRTGTTAASASGGTTSSSGGTGNGSGQSR